MLIGIGMLVPFAKEEPGARAALAARRRVRAGRRYGEDHPVHVVLPAAELRVSVEPALATADALRRHDPDVEITRRHGLRV
jgi:hypothetical protein